MMRRIGDAKQVLGHDHEQDPILRNLFVNEDLSLPPVISEPKKKKVKLDDEDNLTSESHWGKLPLSVQKID